MSDQARFCTACGTALLSDAKFCTGCGATAAAAPAGGERVLSVIANATLKAGFMSMKSKNYVLVLTESRIVLAQITMDMMKKLVADAQAQAKADGKGFMGQWGAQLVSYASFASGYLEMPPDQALAQTPGNFAIERSTISKVKIKQGASFDDGSASNDRLIIKTTDKKYDFTLGSGVGPAKQALQAAGLV